MARVDTVDTINKSLRRCAPLKWGHILHQFFLRHTRIRTRRLLKIGCITLAVTCGSLTLGDVEQAAAQSAMTMSFGPVPTEFVDAGSLAVASLAASADPAGSACAICSAATTGDAGLFAIPPVFLLPQAVELLHQTTDSAFARLRSRHARGSS